MATSSIYYNFKFDDPEVGKRFVKSLDEQIKQSKKNRQIHPS